MAEMGDTSEGLHHWGDLLALLGYFGLTIAVGIWSILKPTRTSVRGYFLAGQSATWWSVGLSLFASNISSEHFIGFAGAGAASGVAIALFEWNAVFLILLLAWVFLPVYLIAGVYTLPEYLMQRFGRERLRILMAIIFIVSTVLVPADLYSGGIFIQQALGWNIYAGIVLIISIAGVYSILGGLSTVMYTDAIQVVIMLAGSAAVTVIGLNRVGGFMELKTKYMQAIPDTLRNLTEDFQYNSTTYANMTGVIIDYPANKTSPSGCGYPREDAWNLFRDPVNADYPSVAVFLRMSFGALFYWCAHQTIVQRVLAAKNISHAKGAAILAGSLKITPFFLMVIPGMVSRVLFPNEVACADPDVCRQVCGSPAGCSNIAYPKLVLTILPVGMRGLMLAVMLSAVISSLTSIYNSVATVVTLDLWCKARPKATPRELLIVGRLSVLVVMGFSVAWVPVMQNADGGQMLRYITAVVGYLGAPMSAIFIMAMFWPRATEQGAFYGFLVAAVSGLVRFCLDSAYSKPRCGQPDTRPILVSAIHPYYFTALQVALGMLVCAVITIFTKPRTRQQLAGLTFWTRDERITQSQPMNGCHSNRVLTTKEDEDAEMTVIQQPSQEATNENAVSDVERGIAEKVKERLRSIICGSSQLRNSEDKASEKEDMATRARKLEQSLISRISLNSLAVLLILAVIGMYIYFR